MDIDVKNALDKVMAVGNGTNIKDGRSFETVLAWDIFRFINSISRQGGPERFNYFCKIYLDGKYNSEQFRDTNNEDVPEVLRLLSAVDSKVNSTTASKILVSFFTVLGRHYMSSAHDRKDIDTARFMEAVKKMNTYTDPSNAGNDRSDTSASATQPTQDAYEDDAASSDAISDVEGASAEEPEETLEELLEQLNSLIGLNGVKKEVKQIINLIKVRKKGEEFGEKMPPLSLHIVFYGNPDNSRKAPR